MVGEAATWAKLDKTKIVTKQYVDKALSERIERIKKYDTKYLEMVKEETLLIDTDRKESWRDKWFNCYYNWRLFFWKTSQNNG